MKNPSAIADAAFVKLRFRDTYVFSSVSGAIGENIFRGNSIYDPQTGLGGIQPLGYDQWAAFYGRYLCMGSKCSVTFTRTSAAPLPVEYLISANHDSTSISDMDSAAAQPYATRIAREQFSGTVTLKKYMSTAKLFGVKRIAPDVDEAYAADFGTDPTNTWYWKIAAQAADKTSTQSIIGFVDITYYCRLYHRVNLPQST